jgi:protoheme IX farnesyltransferase
MIPESRVLDVAAARAGRRVAAFVELSKPRLVVMILLTTGVGFYLGSRGMPDYLRLLPTLIGTALAAAGTLALNQYIERDTDAKMRRTQSRPLPEGRLLAADALLFGIVTTAAGLVYLTVAVNALSGLVTAVITVSYLFVYTPMKRRTPLCTIMGAIPGALPPVTGWAAARGGLGMEAWILFAILFLWQLPHSLAIARLYRDDYARAGIRFLPVVEPDARSTARQIVSNSLALLVVGLLPTLVGMAGSVYFVCALALSGALLAYGVSFALSRTASAARQLLLASLLYLPALLIAMALDKVPSVLLIR